MSNESEKPDFHEFDPQKKNLNPKPQQQLNGFFKYGKRRPAINGIKWFISAWEIYNKSPFMWIMFLIIWFLTRITISIIPLVGFFTFLYDFLILAGFIYAAYKVDKGNKLDIVYLFYSFKIKYFIALLILMIPLIAFAIYLIFYIPDILKVVESTGDTENLNKEVFDNLFASIQLILTLLFAILSVFYFWSVYYVFPLILLQNLSPFTAMKSFCIAVLKNILPVLVNLFAHLSIIITFTLVILIAYFLDRLIDSEIITILIYTITFIVVFISFFVYALLTIIITYNIFKDVFWLNQDFTIPVEITK